MENKIETRCLSRKFKYFKQSRVTTDTNAIPILIIGYTIAMIKIKNFHYLYNKHFVFKNDYEKARVVFIEFEISINIYCSFVNSSRYIQTSLCKKTKKYIHSNVMIHEIQE